MEQKSESKSRPFSGGREAYRTGQHAFSPTEFRRLLDVCDSQEDRVLIMTGAGLGLRRADIVRLKWSDIDLENSRLSYQERKKGDRIRTVPLGPRLSQELRILRTSRPGSTKVFSFSDRTAYNRLQYLCIRAGIPGRPFHALRSTCVKFKQRAGWSVESTAELIGDSVRVVQEHYTIPTDAELRESMLEHEAIP